MMRCDRVAMHITKYIYIYKYLHENEQSTKRDRRGLYTGKEHTFT